MIDEENVPPFKINGWLNIYKPRGITSAKLVGSVKRILGKVKIGHTGTLDPEAEGVLPLAIGEATKLCSILIDGRKKYIFRIQFGAKTTTGDIEGEIVEKTSFIPSKEACQKIVGDFIGILRQVPPIFSAIKIDGKRAYDIARSNQTCIMPEREITIYDLKFLDYDKENFTAEYEVECSKGTYVRTLAEDISLSLQSLGFVIELRRTQVASFLEEKSISFADLALLNREEACSKLLQNISKVDSVLDDIPVLDIDDEAAYKVRCGQQLYLNESDKDKLWLRYQNNVLSIGSLYQGRFNSARVFNL